MTSSRLIAETKVAVTAVAATHTFNTATKACKIYNNGKGVVYRNFTPPATSGDKPIYQRFSEPIDIDHPSVSLVCAAGKTATAWVVEFG